MAFGLRQAVGLALALRLLLVVYGEWQDAHFRVRYTDIDYVVYTDAARYVADGASPYLRATYRYSPLLAYLLVPNVLLHPAWGKLLFAGADVLVGVLVYRTLQRALAPALALQYACLYLFNPVAINVCTRGNADALAAALIVGTLYCLLAGRTVAAAVLHGVAVHFRIFPVVFSLAYALHVHRTAAGASRDGRRRAAPARPFPFSAACVTFAAVSLLSFLAPLAGFYLRYGHEFLQHTYLHHLTRADNRHNFSVYFYHIYLSLADPAAALGLAGRLAGFVPQLAITLCVSLACHRDLPLAVVLLTWSFVAFNKVYTVQYFIWYLSLLPLLLPWCTRRRALALPAIAAWVAALAAWFAFAYKLEFEGENTFLAIWVAGIAFFVANLGCMGALLAAYHPRDPPRPLWRVAAPRP